MQRKLFLLLYSFILMIVWGLSFISVRQADAYTAALGLTFTFLSVYFVQKHYAFDLSRADKLAIVALPACYAAAFYVVLYNGGHFSTDRPNWYGRLIYIQLINPLNIALLFLWLGMTRMREVFRPVNLFIFCFVTLFYAYVFYGEFEASRYVNGG
jgi:hypothetical protein